MLPGAGAQIVPSRGPWALLSPAPPCPSPSPKEELLPSPLIALFPSPLQALRHRLASHQAPARGVPLTGLSRTAGSRLAIALRPKGWGGHRAQARAGGVALHFAVQTARPYRLPPALAHPLMRCATPPRRQQEATSLMAQPREAAHADRPWQRHAGGPGSIWGDPTAAMATLGVEGEARDRIDPGNAGHAECGGQGQQ